MNASWVKDRLINVLIYGAIILTTGFILYSAFLKPTTTNKTTQDANQISNSLAGGTVKVGFGGCAHFSGYPKEKK